MRVNKNNLIINFLVLSAVLFLNINPVFSETKQTQEVNRVTVKSNSTQTVNESHDYSNNYLEEVYQKYKQIVKWKKNYILVYIPMDEREAFVWSQFKVWEKALNGTIFFEQILTEKGADIAVQYANQYLGKKAGYTKLAFKDGLVTHADLFIYDDILENPLRKYCVLHEIGHALGLTAHSSNPADIMYETMTGRQNGLSIRDINTVMAIYDIGDETKISPVQINKENYKKNADIEKANILFNKEQYEPAIKLYEKVIKDNENLGEAYYGLARCYFALDNKQKSYKYAKKAYNEDTNNKAYLYGYIQIALSSNHHTELRKFLNQYMLEKDDAILDRTVQSALIYLEKEKTAKKENTK